MAEKSEKLNKKLESFKTLYSINFDKYMSYKKEDYLYTYYGGMLDGIAASAQIMLTACDFPSFCLYTDALNKKKQDRDFPPKMPW